MNYKKELDRVAAIASEVFFELHGDSDTACIKIFLDNGLCDAMLIQWLEEDGSTAVHDTLNEFNEVFFARVGRVLCCSNNHPTDGTIQYLIEPDPNEVFNPNRHKESFFSRYDYWLKNGMSQKVGHSMHETFRLLHKTLIDKGDDIERVYDLFNCKEEFHNQVMRYYSDYETGTEHYIPED